MFPNFETTAESTPYLDLLFIENENSELKIENDLDIAIVTQIRAWSTVVGGTLSGAPFALRRGAYSFTSVPSPYLRIFYPLYNGENLETTVGFY